MRTGLFILGACILATAIEANSSAEEPAPEAGKELLGCWQNERDPKEIIRFESSRRTCLLNGKLSFELARYGEGTVTGADSGTYKFEVKNNKLILTFLKDSPNRKAIISIPIPFGWGNQSEQYTKLDEAPAGLELKPMQFGEAKPVSNEKRDEINAELKNRLSADQAVRLADIAELQKDMPKMMKFALEMKKVDAENTAALTKLVKEYGWIDAARFGADASNAAFLIVQHCGDLSFMLAALPEIKKDLKAKRIEGHAYALLYDRLQLRLGHKQRYGSQFRVRENDAIVLPLEDRDKVDQLRKEIGEIPLKEYLASFKNVVFAED